MTGVHEHRSDHHAYNCYNAMRKEKSTHSGISMHLSTVDTPSYTLYMYMYVLAHAYDALL